MRLLPIALFAVPAVVALASAPDRRPPPPRGAGGATPMELYTRHCAPCHGERGRGDGPAARFLHPPPRDLRLGAFRFVTTQNRVPSDKDLHQVVSAGLPGSAMLGFANLGPDAVASLAGVVREFHREGVRERLREDARDADELARWVREETTPGPAVRVGPEPPDDRASRFRGHLHYAQNCASCHGPHGHGGVRDDLKASEGHELSARDLSQGVLKGSFTPRDLFRRIRVGLPGTPMPAVGRDALDDDGVWDLVHYLGTLLPDGARALHDPVPTVVRAVRVRGVLPESPDDPRFRDAPEAHVPLAPMRSEEWTVRGLSVRALHDGEVVAFSVRYADPTLDPAADGSTAPDGLAVRTTHLPDAPVIPNPGLALPLDRMLWVSDPMPPPEAPVFDAVEPRFDNPDRLCVAPVRPQQGGTGTWTGGVWKVMLAIEPLKSGPVKDGGTMRVSFAAFDGSLRRGPMPIAFSHWNVLRFVGPDERGDDR